MALPRLARHARILLLSPRGVSMAERARRVRRDEGGEARRGQAVPPAASKAATHAHAGRIPRQPIVAALPSAAAMLPGARSDASLLADSRDDDTPAFRGAVASDATSAPALQLWELLDARRTLKEWTLTRFLAARPREPPVVFSCDTTIGAALKVRERARIPRGRAASACSCLGR